MNPEERTAHWQAVYDAKLLESCSWYQPVPTTSLDLIAGMHLAQDAPILDVGGGDGFLVDHLLARGFTDVTVLDISSKAIERAKDRLGVDASRVKWIVADVTTFEPVRSYALWHDRAAFHFLTSTKDRESYLNALHSATSQGSKVIVATFSTNGPTKCSGTVIQQHDVASLVATFAANWTPIRTFSKEHVTPSGDVQEFVFGVFQRT